MNIVIIGSGNVAAVLGRKFVAAGHHIVQILSRNASAASELAYEWNTESANYSSLINKDADVYIIAVADDAIGDVANDLRLPGKVVAHTAAAVKMDVLKEVTDNYGVFYPLQSLRKEQEQIPEIPIYIEGVNEQTKNVLNKLARSVYKEASFSADFDKRTKLHIGAVLVNNFSNHIFSLAETYCKKEGIEFAELLPLIDNTFYRLHDAAPSSLQTGPAARGDMETINKHRALLDKHPQLLKLYEFLTESILGQPLKQLD
ncbi:Rossmann-like and DUF2520 domain-containing protein [Niabella sp. 22666]|uniref:Rossmann-like and DUF2520 domain-containing protein n=1 Tax=Niabella sp. 22666 TaxID=3453954 RepID=UPI003F851CA5